MKMPEQQYCLRWNNHQPNFISTFSSLLTDECLVDVTLAAEGEYVQAHKIVLSACSVYFRTLFSVNPCQHPIVVLKDVTHQDLKSVIDFMYHGEVNVSYEHLESVLKTAVALNIKGLADMAVTFSSDKKNVDRSNDFPSPSKRKRLRKSTRSESEVKNISSDVEVVGFRDMNQKVENDVASTSDLIVHVKEEIEEDLENNAGMEQNPVCSASYKFLTKAPSEPPTSPNEDSTGISVITGVKRRGRLLIRQGNVIKPSDIEDDSVESETEPTENKRSLIRQHSDPTPQQNQPAFSLPLPETTKKSKFLVVTNPHLQKQNSDSALTVPRDDQQATLFSNLVNDPVKFQYSHPKSNHCPTLRPGPALGCNFCWNTIDLHGRILRRKTKYHCPECRTNLCIVPCFQDYHKKKELENEKISVKENVDESSAASPPISSVKKQLKQTLIDMKIK